MSMSRRELCGLLPVMFSAGAVALEAAVPEDTAIPSEAFSFEDLTVHTGKTGAQTRPVLKGKLATGESLEVHETMLPPGGMPHAPHHHTHSEMWLIREGTVELTVNGTGHRIGAGGVGFVHSNDEHGIKNVGSEPANYFVVAIGPGAAGV